MIITLTGTNAYLIDEKLARIIADFKKNNNSLSIERISIEDKEFEDFKQSLTSYSLFSEARLVILDQPSHSKLFTEVFEEILNSLAETTDLVIIEPTLDKRLTYYKTLQKKTELVMNSNLADSDLISWIVNRAKQLGGSIDKVSAKHLLERAGDDQLLINSELEKLIIYNKVITNNSIDLLTVESSASTIFQLLDAAFNDRAKHALEIYDKQRYAKVQPIEILGMFVWQLHLVAICLMADGKGISELASKTKISPFSLTNSMRITRKVNLISLKKIVRKLLEIDYKSKTISYDLDQALKNFIVETSTFS